MTSSSRPTLEEVLNAFSVEDAGNMTILARYLKDYPEYAEDLIDLSREIHRTVLEDETELSTHDKSRIETAWQRFSDATLVAVADPLAALSVAEMRELATTLGVKRQVLAAFREHRVVVASIPAKFLSRLAASAKTTAEQVKQVLSAPLTLSPARSHKSDATPEDGGPVTFERLLIDAGHSEAERSALMSEED
jgi:hypothetical protein